MRKYICSNRLATKPCSLRLAHTITMGSDEAQLKCKECGYELEPLTEEDKPNTRPLPIKKYATILLTILAVIAVIILLIGYNKGNVAEITPPMPQAEPQDQMPANTLGKRADRKPYTPPLPKPDPPYYNKMALTDIQHFFDDLSSGHAPYSAKSAFLKSGIDHFFTSSEAKIAIVGKNNTQTDEMPVSDFGELLCTSGQRYQFVRSEIEGMKYSKVYVIAQ